MEQNKFIAQFSNLSQSQHQVSSTVPSSQNAGLKKNATQVKTREDTDVMNLRKDHQIQSKRSLLQSGGNNPVISDKHSPKIMNNSSKKTPVMNGKTPGENVEDVKLPKLDPTKTSIAQHHNIPNKLPNQLTGKTNTGKPMRMSHHQVGNASKSAINHTQAHNRNPAEGNMGYMANKFTTEKRMQSCDRGGVASKSTPNRY